MSLDILPGCLVCGKIDYYCTCDNYWTAKLVMAAPTGRLQSTLIDVTIERELDGRQDRLIQAIKEELKARGVECS